MNRFRSFWQTVLDVFFPRTCVLCQARLAPGEEQLCATCLYGLPLVHLSSYNENPLTDRFIGLYPVLRGASLFHYHKGSQVNQILFELKYRGNPEIGRVLGRLLARTLMSQGFFQGIDCLVPVPLARKRYWQRGYNQSEWLARGVSEITGIPVRQDVVRRKRNNPSQTRLNKVDRMENVRSLFQTTPRAADLSGRHLLLIDDVFTTGATMLSLCEALAVIPDVRFSILTLAWAGH